MKWKTKSFPLTTKADYQPLFLVMITTIRTFQDNGPYFSCTRGCYQAASLHELLFHVRLAMEDREHVIGIYGPDGACKGVWQLETEGHVDSAGDSIVDHEAYALMRPSTKSQWTWQFMQKQLGQV
jgi:hypothetical protein